MTKEIKTSEILSDYDRKILVAEIDSIAITVGKLYSESIRQQEHLSQSRAYLLQIGESLSKMRNRSLRKL